MVFDQKMKNQKLLDLTNPQLVLTKSAVLLNKK